MKKMKLIFTRKEWWTLFKRTLKLLVESFGMLIWSIILLIINLAASFFLWLVWLIRKHPVVSVCVTFAIMLIAVVMVHMSMKYKLTTTEWQRDSLEQKIDSIKVLYSDKVGYYRYQGYKEK